MLRQLAPVTNNLRELAALWHLEDYHDANERRLAEKQQQLKNIDDSACTALAALPSPSACKSQMPRRWWSLSWLPSGRGRTTAW